MDSNKRRQQIKEKLKDATAPISATALAKELGVSRQIIVGDIALLRAAGEAIHATPRGYVLGHADGVSSEKCQQIVCQHTDDKTEEELNIIVDYGCTALDVIVEHPVYGQLTGTLDISSRYDVKSFLEKVKNAEAHSLCELTDGIHLHTIRYPDEDCFTQMVQALKAAGFLYVK